MIKKSIPSLMTLTHVSLGLLSIISSFNDEFSRASFLIIIGMILDGFDGRVARALNVASDFGKELDSLADVVTFGVAPSFVLYQAEFHSLGNIGLILTLLFPICGILRLARFNVSGYKVTRYFVGLPITAAGSILSIISVYHDIFHSTLLIFFSVLLSFLMVSTIKYPNFKKLSIPKSAYFVTPIAFILLCLLNKWFPHHFHLLLWIPLMIFIVFVFYLIKKRIEQKKSLIDFTEEIEEDENE